jgi:hypothetical protein
MLGKLLRGTALVVVGALVALTLTGFGVINMFTSWFQGSQVDRSQPVMLKSIQDMRQFHAAVGNFEVLLDIEDEAGWLPEFIAGRRTLFVGAGTVNSYVDFSGFADGDLNLSMDGKSLTIRLPEAKLDKPNLNLDRSGIYDQDRGVIERIADAIDTPEQKQFFMMAETKMAAAAQESELLKQATENTKSMLIGTFGSVGLEVNFI